MKKQKNFDLSKVKESFSDKVKEYEDMAVNEDADPEELAQLRLDLIREAKKAIEDKTSAAAKCWYGYNLVTGADGFPVNIDKGILLLNEAVMMRALHANGYLGDIYSLEMPGIPEEKGDIEKAIKHYKQADNGYAHYRLALIYSANPKVKDIRKALDAVERSYNLGENRGKLLLGVWRYYGDYVSVDYQKAYEMISEVQEQEGISTWYGLAALYYLGLMTFDGHYMQQDQEAGLRMIEEAASYGDPDAIDWLRQFDAAQAAR